jgi:hypothetical protein
MSRRILFMGLAILVSQIATGCCTQRAYLFPRLHCGACAPPAVPMSPVVRYPIAVRPLGAYPVMGAPAPAMGDPGCSSCLASPAATVSLAPRMASGAPIYAAGATGYGTAVPHDSVLLPQPTVIRRSNNRPNPSRCRSKTAGMCHRLTQINTDEIRNFG